MLHFIDPVYCKLLRPSYAIDQAEAVGPSILHSKDHGYGKNYDEPHESAILRKMHEEQKREPALENGDGQHADEHLGGADVLIGNYELDPSEHQQAKVDAHVSSDSTRLMRVGCSHSSSRSFLPPPSGLAHLHSRTHGLRHGLHSYAASRLKPASSGSGSTDRPGAQQTSKPSPRSASRVR